MNITRYLILLLLAAALLYQMCRTTNQAMMSIVIGTEFVGEYSQNGSEWKPLTEDTRLSAFDGDLILRGQIKELLSMSCLSFYLNHIGVVIAVNDEEVFYTGVLMSEDRASETECAARWSNWLPDGINSEDEIEIRLHNSHLYGNADAYNEFLHSLYLGGETALQKHLGRQSMLSQVTGIVIIVISVALLGMSLGYLVQKLPFGSLLWSAGLMSLFMGGYIFMDTKDIEFRSALIAFNTCVRQYCIMFAALALAVCVEKTLTGKEKKIAEYLINGLWAVTGILLILSLAGRMSVYDTGLFWAIAQGSVSLVLLAFCIAEYRRGAGADRSLLLSYAILLSAVLLELMNARSGVWTNGIVIKVIFVLLFAFHLVRAIKLVAANQQASVTAKKLEEELKNSRIVLAMSQIQPHFIYNALGAIRSLCVEDTKTAIEAIDRFSCYLRGSFEAMDKEKCISFHKEMELVDSYLYLEKQRFGDKIKVEKDIKAEDFMLPPMSVQPIVENAVRHGIRKKRAAGTVTIKSFEEENAFIVTVTDDGIGFDVSVPKSDGKVHVGLQNVQKRLQLMCKGSLKADSTPGQGTTVTLCIPKTMKDKGKKE